MHQKPLYTSLLIAGCLPFMLAALAPYFGIVSMPILGNLQNAAAYYGLAIVSLMAGVHWGISLMLDSAPQMRKKNPLCKKTMMWASNTFVLIPWLILCAAGVGTPFYFSLSVSFMLILITDYRLMDRGILPEHYYRIRFIITSIIVTCLISLAFTAS